MSIHEKLNIIQTKLVAPKGQFNKFGNYAYRSSEDILAAVKPLLDFTKTTINLSDEVLYIGERYYIKAVVTLTDIETGEKVYSQALAREEETKKGMDSSMITGSASSYARKYALSGLFGIDDIKDDDNADGKEEKPEPKVEPKPKPKLATPEQVLNIQAGVPSDIVNKALEYYKVAKLDDLTQEQAKALLSRAKK
jgi:hypothetical protein